MISTLYLKSSTCNPTITKYDPEIEKRNRDIKNYKVSLKFDDSLRLFNARIADQPVQNTKEGHNDSLSCDQNVALREGVKFLIADGHQANNNAIRRGAISLLHTLNVDQKSILAMGQLLEEVQ